MSRCIIYGILNDEKYKKMHDISRRVYDPQGISPAIHTSGGGNQVVKIVTWGGLQEHQTPRTDEISPTIPAAAGMGGGHTPIVAALRGRGEDNKQMLELGGERSDSLTTVQTDNLVVSGIYTNVSHGYGGKPMENLSRAVRAENSRFDGVALVPQRKYDDDGDRSVAHTISDISPAILGSQYKSGDNQPKAFENMRIRKYTPRECWRLMDFDDEDFDKAQAAGISNTQLYKQAGNSIVVSVLEAIFKQMIRGK